MNDPNRLLTFGASEAELALLRAGALEEPPLDGAAKLALALGLPPPTITLPGTPAPSNDVVGAPAGPAAKLSLKWLLIAGGGLSALGLTALTLVTPPARPVAKPPALSAPARAPEAQRPDEPAEPSVELTERRGRAPSSTLAQELAELDRARSLLHKREPAAALARLHAYEARFREGTLREEALFLRFQASTQVQGGAAAADEARSFLRAYPDSVHAVRVRTWLAEGQHAPR